VALSTNDVQTAGLRVRYLQQGTGEPVVLVHGFPQTSYEWRHQMAPLAESGHAVFAPDTRGFGGTDKPHVRVTRQLLARDVVDLLDALGLERVHLVGHDWGGIIAFAAAVEHPERFATLGLIDTLATVWVPWAVHGYWFKSAGRAEDFFARHAVEWIRSVFGGVRGSYAGPPVSPWAPPPGAARPARVDDPAKHWGPDDVERFAAAFADPDSHWHAIQYYRYALPFHRIRPGAGPEGRDAYDFLDEPAVAAMWEHPGGLGAHPWAGEYLAFAPEHRDRTYPGPALYLGSPYLESRRPDDPFADSFRRSLPALTVARADCGHFVPEERPQLTTDALLALFRSGPA
jgi:pimeloyl-ACP methyl ester carboxylesterase